MKQTITEIKKNEMRSIDCIAIANRIPSYAY